MPYFIDGSDAMANKGFIVSFQHVPSKEDVNFKAFITAFNETYNVDWNAETVYGRADPIYMYKSTGREITLALRVPAGTEGEAFENLARVQRLVTFLYPTYSDTSGEEITAGNQPDTTNALTIANSPLVRLRVMNILAARPQIGDARGGPRANEEAVYSTLGTFQRHVEDGGGAEWPTTSIGSNTIAGNYHGGILGVVKNLTVNHNLENPDVGVFEINKGTILPKMIEINLTFGVIHEHTVGWLPDGDSQSFSNKLFPYGVNDMAGATNDQVEDTRTLMQANITGSNLLLEQVDELEEKVEQTEQDIANAEARYAGLFGRARFNKDTKRLQRLAVRSELRSAAGKDTSRIDARGEYLASSQRGVEAEGGWDEFIK